MTQPPSRAASNRALFGRSIPGLVAKDFGSINILNFFMLVCIMIHFCWIPIHTVAGILSFGINYL